MTNDIPANEPKPPIEKDFGHTYASAAGIRIDAWGRGPFLIEAKGSIYAFEDSDRFGPALLTKTGGIADKQPGERHVFWGPYHRWLRSGRPLADDGKTCIVAPARDTVINKIPKGPSFLVEEGDPDGKRIVNVMTKEEVDALLKKIRSRI